MNQKAQAYLEFLKSKIVAADESGFHISEEDINPILKPHQRDSVLWAVRGGRRALFESFGLGKTIIQLEILRIILKAEGGKGLIVCPLGVKQEFAHDAEVLLGLRIRYVRSMEECRAAEETILITNYERVRDGDIDPNYFTVCSLDEASVLRSYGSKTYQEFLPLFSRVPYRFVCTATPSPNRFKELIHYAGFLGVMDTGQALTRFFQRDSSQANNLTLYPHKEEEFWLWVSTWALFITKPSDLGYDDAGYDLPPMEVFYHEVGVDHATAGTEQDGQVKLFRDAALGLKDAAREKRDGIIRRVEEIGNILYKYSCIASLKQRDTHDAGRTKEVSEGILSEEQARITCETENTECQELPREQREIQSKKPEVEEGQSRKIQNSSTALFGDEQGENKCQIGSVVPGQQRESGSPIEKTETGIYRDDARGLCGTIEGAKRRLCNMREDQSNRYEKTTTYRSLSRNGRDKGPSLSSLQCWIGSFQRRHTTASDGNCISEQYVIWCDLNDEQKAIESLLTHLHITFSSIYGYQSIEEKERLLLDWKEKKTSVLLSKTEMLGAGTNLQQCSIMIFAGINYKFYDFFQGIHRIHRFGQPYIAKIHVIYTESERAILDVLKQKWEQHDRLVSNMIAIMQRYGLSSTNVMEKLARTIGVSRQVAAGDRFTAIHNDCVLECQGMPDNSIDLIHTSIPFGNHYEYSPSYNDFGHNEDNDRFFAQMDYLTPELLRILKPGRVAAIHVKDRILFGNATGTGMPTVDPFSDLTTAHYMKHGFQFFGRITILTDVVRENNQTYRLGWTEQCKDGSKMGVGCPEYVLLFRKLPTDTSRAYADSPVVKTKKEYTRAQWQIDANAFWRSSGDRLLTREELEEVPVDALQGVYRDYSRGTVYDYDDHVTLAKDLEDARKLPKSFSVVAPGSWSPMIWDDINRMYTLNSDQARKGVQMHICPLQFDIVERIITRFSNRGDVVLDPFGGLMTVPYMAVKLGRKGIGIELTYDSWKDGIGYLKAAEIEAAAPTLFDLAEVAR